MLFVELVSIYLGILCKRYLNAYLAMASRGRYHSVSLLRIYFKCNGMQGDHMDIQSGKSGSYSSTLFEG